MIECIWQWGEEKEFFFYVSLWFISIEIYNTNPSPYPNPNFFTWHFLKQASSIIAKKLWPKYKQDFFWLFSSLGSHNSNVLNSLASDACDTKRNSHQLDSYQWENGFKERHRRTEPIQLNNLNFSISNMKEAGSKWKDDLSTSNSRHRSKEVGCRNKQLTIPQEGILLHF